MLRRGSLIGPKWQRGAQASVSELLITCRALPLPWRPLNLCSDVNYKLKASRRSAATSCHSLNLEMIHNCFSATVGVDGVLTPSLSFVVVYFLSVFSLRRCQSNERACQPLLLLLQRSRPDTFCYRVWYGWTSLSLFSQQTSNTQVELISKFNSSSENVYRQFVSVIWRLRVTHISYKVDHDRLRTSGGIWKQSHDEEESHIVHNV